MEILFRCIMFFFFSRFYTFSQLISKGQHTLAASSHSSSWFRASESVTVVLYVPGKLSGFDATSGSWHGSRDVTWFSWYVLQFLYYHVEWKISNQWYKSCFTWILNSHTVILGRSSLVTLSNVCQKLDVFATTHAKYDIFVSWLVDD